MRSLSSRPVALVVGFVTSAIVAGCSLLVDTSGLSGGTTGADAAGAADGASAGDGGGDGGDGSASSRTFCANESPPHAFCTDFDDKPLDFGWSKVASDPGIAIELDPLATSTPSSVRTRVVTSKACSYANLSRVLPGPYQRGRFAFDVRVGAAVDPKFGDAYVGYVELGKCLHLLQIGPTATSVYTQIDFPAGEDRQLAPVVIPPGIWRRIALDFDRTDGSIQLSIAGTVVIPKKVVDARCVGAASVKISVGLFCQTELAEARFDDVTFDGN